jgi:hypothetical protein
MPIVMARKKLQGKDPLIVRMEIAKYEAVSDRVRMSFVLDGNLEVSRGALLESIRKTDGITTVDLTERGENGLSTLRVEGDVNFDYSALFAFLLSVRLRIRSVETTSPSLEDAFVRLTAETKSP